MVQNPKKKIILLHPIPTIHPPQPLPDLTILPHNIDPPIEINPANTDIIPPVHILHTRFPLKLHQHIPTENMLIQLYREVPLPQIRFFVFYSHFLDTLPDTFNIPNRNFYFF
jgi:hypothetical protein